MTEMPPINPAHARGQVAGLKAAIAREGLRLRKSRHAIAASTRNLLEYVGRPEIAAALGTPALDEVAEFARRVRSLIDRRSAEPEPEPEPAPPPAVEPESEPEPGHPVDCHRKLSRAAVRLAVRRLEGTRADAEKIRGLGDRYFEARRARSGDTGADDDLARALVDAARDAVAAARAGAVRTILAAVGETTAAGTPRTTWSACGVGFDGRYFIAAPDPDAPDPYDPDGAILTIVSIGDLVQISDDTMDEYTRDDPDSDDPA